MPRNRPPSRSVPRVWSWIIPGAFLSALFSLGFLLGAMITANWVNRVTELGVGNIVQITGAYYEGLFRNGTYIGTALGGDLEILSGDRFFEAMTGGSEKGTPLILAQAAAVLAGVLLLGGCILNLLTGWRICYSVPAAIAHGGALALEGVTFISFLFFNRDGPWLPEDFAPRDVWWENIGIGVYFMIAAMVFALAATLFSIAAAAAKGVHERMNASCSNSSGTKRYPVKTHHARVLSSAERGGRGQGGQGRVEVGRPIVG